MIAQTEERVRAEASRKGMELVQIPRDSEADGAPSLYELIVPEQRVRIYPQGVGVMGAPLKEIEYWLSWPWK
jgi:hypothetical protein